jgi:phosphoenolpyruvate---glycerone phosphotransferase subunit DhaK
MKPLIIDRAMLAKDMIDGLVAGYNGSAVKADGVNGLVKKDIPQLKVALLVRGGIGHEPICHGLIGESMADAVGNIFASPNPQVVYETAKACQRGSGVLLVCGSYAGDVMSFDIAAERKAYQSEPSPSTTM